MDAKYTAVEILSLLLPVFCWCSDVDIACGRNQPLQLNLTRGDIYSPGFLENKNYPANSECTYHLSIPNDKNVIIEFKFLDLEASSSCERDFLAVHSKDKEILYGLFCGSNVTEKLLLKTDHVVFTFKSDFIISGKGFHIAYEITSQKSFCGARELQCKNNNCVPASAICNKKDDCGDGTDEEDCREKINQKAKCGVPSISPGPDYSHRIVGGKEAVPGSWPWQAGLQVAVVHPSGHSCGGSLLNSQWVVTAAHCVIQYTSSEKLRVRLGNHHLFRKDPHEQIRYVKSIFFYPHFNNLYEEMAVHDIALLKLNAEVEFTSYVSPICLPPNGLEVKLGTKCISTGWGKTKGSGGSNVLKEVSVNIINSTLCDNQFLAMNDDTMICAEGHNDHGGICTGDSGGPLVCQIDNIWYLFGITSFGTEVTPQGAEICGVQSIPFVYQKITSKLRWIHNVVNEN